MQALNQTHPTPWPTNGTLPHNMTRTLRRGYYAAVSWCDFLIGELLCSTHRLLHARRYARPTAADEAAAGEGGAGGPTELSVARATPCAAICEASSCLFARPHISARGGRRDAEAR